MNPVATALDLRDIHAAPAPAYWPPAPGWWLLAILMVIVLLVLGVWLFRRYRNNRHRNKILDQINSLSFCNTVESKLAFIAGVSMLLRRIALQRYPREQVASLTGMDWLRFLDETGGEGDFQRGVGSILAAGAYAPQVKALPAEQLLALARRWAGRNISVKT